MSAKPVIAGVVLAGGGASRFGGGAKDEALLEGQALIDRVIARARSQVGALCISRAAPVSAQERGLPVVPDQHTDGGPLAGLYAGLVWARGLAPAASHVMTFACDTPCFPDDLAAQLAGALAHGDAEIALPRKDGRIHTACGLWPVAVAGDLGAALSSGERAMTRWALGRTTVLVDFDAGPPWDFFNVNTREDLAALGRLLAATGDEAAENRG
ncbi:MAG: NTP transferase domain-containing protein [Amphiplicatus sp.]